MFLLGKQELLPHQNVGLQYNRARWLSTDPIGFGGGDVNLYRTVGNHPTSATDPSGLEEPVNRKAPDFAPLPFDLSPEDRKVLDDFLLGRTRNVEAPITVVSGVFGSSIHLNDSYFTMLEIPTVVCHGRTAGRMVGPPNSFRFPGGPGQLQHYQGLRDTTTSMVIGVGIAAGANGTAAISTGVLVLPVTNSLTAEVIVLKNGASLIGWVRNGKIVGMSLPNTSHAALGARLGVVCEGAAVEGAQAVTVIKEGGKIYVFGSRNFGGVMSISDDVVSLIKAIYK